MARLDEAIGKLSDTATVHFSDGRTISGYDLKNVWAHTTFDINDQNYNNGGVGAVEGSLSTGFIDHLNYAAFTGAGSWADPNYVDLQGVAFTLMHELGHMTANGLDFSQRSWQQFHNETHGYDWSIYNLSEYWYNNESYVNDFAHDLSLMLNIDTTQAQQAIDHGPYPGFGATTPEAIYGWHMNF